MTPEHEDENELPPASGTRIEHDAADDSAEDLLDDFSDDTPRVEHQPPLEDVDTEADDDSPVSLPSARYERGNLGQLLVSVISVASLIAAASVGAYSFNRMNELSAQIGDLRNATNSSADADSAGAATTEIERLNGVIADLSNKLDALTQRAALDNAASDSSTTQPLVDVSTSSNAVDQVAEELRKQQEILDAMSKAKKENGDELRLKAPITP